MAVKAKGRPSEDGGGARAAPGTVANRVRACHELLGRDLRTRQVELQVALTLAETLGAAVLRETSG